jgi:uncharacterized surface protein with fasciclin (FAS1) repeats
MKRSTIALGFLAVLSLTALTVTYAKLPQDVFVPSRYDFASAGMSSGAVRAWEAPSIMAILDSRSEFSNFRRAVEKAGLSPMLDEKGPFTVFVPTDEAFYRLPSAAEEQILKDSSAAKSVVLNQITPGDLLYGAPNADMDLSRIGIILTSDGNHIPVVVSQRDVRVGQSRLLKANLKASNGIIHVVDDLNLPPEV